MMRSIVAQEHGNGCRGDDDVANPAESIGNLTEDEIAENCRKDNLAIVIRPPVEMVRKWLFSSPN